MRHRRNDDPLLIRNLGLRRFSHVIVKREVRPHRNVVPRHEPQPGKIQRHVIVIEPALVPGRIIGRALNHPPASRHRHGVRINSVRRIHRLQNVLLRQMPQRLGPVHWRKLLRQVKGLRPTNQILLRGIGRKHRPHLVLLSINPGNKQHLHGPAAIPVPLLVIRGNSSDSRPKTLNIHCRIRRMARRGNPHLVFRGRRASRRAHFTVCPGLRFEPIQHVGSIAPRRAENVVVPFREVMPPLVLHHIRIAALHRRQRRLHIRRQSVAHIPEIKIVGCSHPNNRHWPAGIPRPVNIRRQSHAVPHRYHHFALDNGHRFEFLLRLHSLIFLLLRKRRPLLRSHCPKGNRTSNRNRQAHPSDRIPHRFAVLSTTAARLSLMPSIG